VVYGKDGVLEGLGYGIAGILEDLEGLVYEWRV
jgi:hypothetical protein